MTCPTCSSPADALFIDAMLPLGSHERETIRYCAGCRPEAVHELSGCMPRVLRAMNLPEDVLRAALAARRYVRDRRAEYPIAKRLADLNLSIDEVTNETTF